MGGGRKNLKRAVVEDSLTLQQGQIIMQVVSLRGSNIIEVMDAKGEKSLALFPAKFQKSMWVKRGSFVVVDESGREEALRSGSKVTCIVSQVLFYEQVRRLQKSPDCLTPLQLVSIHSDSFTAALSRPEVFKRTASEGSTTSSQKESSQSEEDDTNLSATRIVQKPSSLLEEDDAVSSDDDGLPPLQSNMNRIRPYESYSDEDSDTSSDTDS